MKRIQGSCGRQGQAASTLPSDEHHAHMTASGLIPPTHSGPVSNGDTGATNPIKGSLPHMSTLPSGPTATTALRPGTERCSLS